MFRLIVTGVCAVVCLAACDRPDSSASHRDTARAGTRALVSSDSSQLVSRDSSQPVAPSTAPAPSDPSSYCGIERPQHLAVMLDSSARDPRIALGTDTHSVMLPGPMYRALMARAPGFRLWQPREYLTDIGRYAGPWVNERPTRYEFNERQALSVVIGDFNGDGRADVVLNGVGDSLLLEAALLSNADSVQFVELGAVPGNRWATPCIGGYLAFTPPGRYSSVEHELEEEALVLETDAFFSVSFEKSSEIYYWRNGQFHRYATSD